jgi:hypothetical protein
MPAQGARAEAARLASRAEDQNVFQAESARVELVPFPKVSSDGKQMPPFDRNDKKEGRNDKTGAGGMTKKNKDDKQMFETLLSKDPSLRIRTRRGRGQPALSQHPNRIYIALKSKRSMNSSMVTGDPTFPIST